MKKNYILVLSLLVIATLNAQQNVGIGTNNPETKLQVNGAISLSPADDAAAASVTIPDNVSIFRLRLTAGGTTTALSVATPKEGQLLTIYNQDDNAATFGGQNILATTGACTFMYINGAWRMTASNSISGPQGPAGPVGPQGAQGPIGPQGTAGVAGAQGPQGLKGATGDTGAQGIQGTQGIQGPVGPAGAAGPQGLKGATGDTGPQGIQGNVGAQGIQGVQGIQGLKGATGSTGGTGPTGTQGVQGVQGPAGTQGIQGIQGPVGPAGAAGAQGPQGLKGATGGTGPTGSQGIQGIQGPAGAQGIQGIQGPAGAAGPQGAQGPAGLLSSGTAAGNTTYWNGSTWVLNSSNIYNNGSNVGIGTNNPQAKLHIASTPAVNTTGNPATSLMWVGGKNDVFDNQYINFRNPSITDANGMAWWSADVIFGRNKNQARWAIKETHGGSLGSAIKDIITVDIGDAGGYNNIDKISIAPAGGTVVNVGSLAGTGTAPVFVDASGNLSRGGVSTGSKVEKLTKVQMVTNTTHYIIFEDANVRIGVYRSGDVYSYSISPKTAGAAGYWDFSREGGGGRLNCSTVNTWYVYPVDWGVNYSGGLTYNVNKEADLTFPTYRITCHLHDTYSSGRRVSAVVEAWYP